MWYALALATLLAAETIDPQPGDVQPMSALPRLVVMPLQGSSLADGTLATLDELMTNAVRSLGKYEVMGMSDIQSMLSAEAAKNSMNCDDVACAVEIGGALGAEHLMAGRVAKLGDNLIFVLKLINTAEQKVIGSTKHKASTDPGTYDKAVEDAVAFLFGLRQPQVEQPKRAQLYPEEMQLARKIPEDKLQQFLYQRTMTPGDMRLREWVDEQNQESTGLFVTELVGAGLFAFGFSLINVKEPIDFGAFAALGLMVALPALIVDYFDIGGVEVAGED